MNQKLLDDINEKLKAVMAQSPAADLERNLRAMLGAAFAKLDLVSREEFDIQREVQLSGPIHAKGVMILAAFLADRYSAERPHAVSASLVFEQTYGEVNGDSASVADAFCEKPA